MKFLLVGINAKYIHSNPAIYSLRACVEEKDRNSVELAEYTINNRTEEILSDIFKRKPDVIGFSCYIWNFHIVRELLWDLVKVLPKTDIWMGGPEVSFDCDRLMKELPMIKGIMVGEGEDTFRELVSCYVNTFSGNQSPADSDLQTMLAKIQGLYLPFGYTGERKLTDLDRLPFYYDSLEDFENRIIYYESSRGCPFRCAYCLSSIDKRVRFRDQEKVKQELQLFLDKKVSQVKFVDRTFNCNHDHAMKIWRYIKENDNNVTNFHFEIAADLLTREQIQLLSEMRPGLVQLEIGVQSTNEETLRAINRPADTIRITDAVAMLQKAKNIHIHLDLIAGLPFEDYDSFVNSFNQVYAMKPHQLQLGFLKVLKGSPMSEKGEEFGIAHTAMPPYEVLYTNWLSYEDILKLKQVEEMVELYYNSNQFLHTLTVLEQEFEDAFSMFSKLADYYERKGYFVVTPARAHRYQVLLKFIREMFPDKSELYRELLTFDYYLRENPKSRPTFMTDVSCYYDYIWRFYQREEVAPHYLQNYQGYHAKQLMKMTHMEPFFYPVWEELPEHTVIRQEQPVFILFDYDKRDALTGNVIAIGPINHVMP